MEKLTKQELKEILKIMDEMGYKITFKRVQLKTKIMALAA